MKKITDRFLLGTFAGLGGNLAKMAVECAFLKRKYTESIGVKKAAGILVKKSDISTPQGRLAGIVADNLIAAMLGVTCVYWLTLMGRDKYILKGSLLGAAEWTALYGLLSRLGATEIYPLKPKEAVAGLFSHLAFGAVKMWIVANLGDERLFKPANLTRKIENPQTLS